MRFYMFLFVIALASSRFSADCDCTIFPFEPDPPCFDVCTAKHLAIAAAEDLTTIARIDQNTARVIARIPEDQRPPSLEGYRLFLTEKKFQDLKKALLQLGGEDFKRIRQKAAKRGKSIY